MIMLQNPATSSPKTEVLPLSKYFVGRETVNKRVKKFQTSKHKLLTERINTGNNGAPKEESRFVWYPKEYFQTLLMEMEHYSANGIRLYFGEYENTTGEPAPGQLGILFVMTQMRQNGKIYDLLIEEQADYIDRLSVPIERGQGLPHEFNAQLPCPPACLNHEPHFPEEEVS